MQQNGLYDLMVNDNELVNGMSNADGDNFVDFSLKKLIQLIMMIVTIVPLVCHDCHFWLSRLPRLFTKGIF